MTKIKWVLIKWNKDMKLISTSLLKPILCPHVLLVKVLVHGCKWGTASVLIIFWKWFQYFLYVHTFSFFYVKKNYFYIFSHLPVHLVLWPSLIKHLLNQSSPDRVNMCLLWVNFLRWLFTPRVSQLISLRHNMAI